MPILLIYYIAGLLQDFLFTLMFRFVSKEKAIQAAIFSFIGTMVAMVIFFDIVTRLSAEESILGIFAYALGISSGTFLAVKTKIDKLIK